MLVVERLHSFDEKFIDFAGKYYGIIARGALFVIFFFFGLLKLIGFSPAGDLALGFAEHMGLGAIAQEMYIALAIVECAIGILIIVPRYTRIAIFAMLAHMLIVSSPLLLYPGAVWNAPFVPNLEGQYIIKNIALVALALGLVARTIPLKKSTR